MGVREVVACGTSSHISVEEPNIYSMELHEVWLNSKIRYLLYVRIFIFLNTL